MPNNMIFGHRSVDLAQFGTHALRDGRNAEAISFVMLQICKTVNNLHNLSSVPLGITLHLVYHLHNVCIKKVSF